MTSLDKQQRAELERRLAFSTGNAFQSVVQEILRCAYRDVWVSPEYQEDGGCDAYVGDTMTAFQIYGPATEKTLAQMKEKVRADAEKIAAGWMNAGVGVSHYVFVVNVPEPPFGLEVPTRTVLRGVDARCWGRHHLIKFVDDNLSRPQLEYRLNLPPFPIEQDRARVRSFLELVNARCGSISQFWMDFGIDKKSFDAVWGGMLEQAIGEARVEVVSQDSDVAQIQAFLVAKINQILLTIEHFTDIHAEAPAPSGKPGETVIVRVHTPFRRGEEKPRQDAFDAVIGPLRGQLKAYWDMLQDYSTALPLGMTQAIRGPSPSWNQI